MRRPPNSGCVRSDGYVVRQRNYVSRYEHIEIAEKALGKPLPPGAIVHHADGNPSNNAPTNLVICPDDAYHLLIHQRMRAMDACGNPNWRKCCRCGQYDDPSNLVVPDRSKQQPYHQSCNTAHQAARRAMKRKQLENAE